MLKPVEDRFLCLVFAFVISIAHVFSVIRLEGEMLAVMSLLYLPVRLIVWSFLSIQRRMAAVIMQVCGDVGFFLWIALYPQEISALGYSPSEMGASMLIGATILLIHAVIVISTRRSTYPDVSSVTFWPNMRLGYCLLGFFGLWFVAFLFSYVSHLTGIAAMGVEVRDEAVLPFRLSGILAYSRIYAVPMFALLFLDVFWERKMRFLFTVSLALLVIFSFVEAYIRLSRGVIVTNMIYVLIWAVIRGRFDLKVLILSSGFVSLIALVYPYISRLRGLMSSGSGTIGDGFRDLLQNQYLFGRMETGFLESLYAVIIRGFSEGTVMCKFIQHLNFELMSGHLDELAIYGNAARYHTHAIDRVERTVAHSSGITLYTDSLFIGGLVFVFVTAALYSWIAYRIDAKKIGPLASTPSITASVCYFYFTTFVGGIIARIQGEPLIFFVLISIWIVMFLLARLISPMSRRSQLPQ